MSEDTIPYKVREGQPVLVRGRADLGVGTVLRLAENYGVTEADVVFETDSGRRLETVPIERLELVPDLWQRAARGRFDPPLNFLLKQLAWQLPLLNTGGQLSNSRTDLLPHQILLTRDVVEAERRRFLIADEVGLGKTIETGMVIRELVARGEADRILIVTPAGLIRNWQEELRDAFRLHFEVLGRDFFDHAAATWESKHRVIASIDALKRPVRLERLLGGPRWDVIIFDEAHHLSRRRYGQKVDVTQNYRLAEALRSHTRDLLFLSATPHQGDAFQFWSLISLLDETLFESAEAIETHRSLLGRVMIRRTKKEVTNARGEPLFMRRQVHSQIFDQAARERRFYDRLTEYLREGYNVAGVGENRTTSRQRAIGFVMATFQKIMSSSPRAIKQALRRRLMVLLTRHQLDLERRRRQTANPGLAEEILNVQEEIQQLARAILATRRDLGDTMDPDGLVLQIRQRVARSLQEETSWALDADEDGDEGIFASANIPGEADRVRDLIRLVPDGPDRKFTTLTRAMDDLRRQNVDERFVIFTQYLETVAFLCEELGRTYGREKIAMIRGGPLERKIEAVEQFWREGGARILLCTSAGGEGINLQVGRVLFNYDLPWNPMAVEQRIGRIHRYGQQDTCQVYNLIARDTVEERIYGMLEDKLQEIARAIGKLDPVTGQPLEDFRSQILGMLGASPNYQALYMKAVVDKDYKRTERELEEMLKSAREAAEAIAALTQDLRSFNLQDYLQIEGRVTLEDLRPWTEQGILALEGAVLPQNGVFRIETPPALRAEAGLAARYEQATLDRATAMKKRRADLLGLGHPLVDGMLAFFKSHRWHGDVTCLAEPSGAVSPRLVLRALLTVEGEAKHTIQEIKIMQIDPEGRFSLLPDDWDLARLASGQYVPHRLPARFDDLPWERWRQVYDRNIGAILTQTRLKVEKPLSARVQLLGICLAVS